MGSFRDGFTVNVFRIVLSTAATLLLTCNTFAATYDWIGGTSTNVSTGTNWYNENTGLYGTVPGTLDDVYIDYNYAIVNQPIVTASKTWKSLTLGYGDTWVSYTYGYKAFLTLTVNSGVTLTITGNVTQNHYTSVAGSPHNYTVTTIGGTGTLLCQGNFLVGDALTQPASSVAEASQVSIQVTQLTINGNIVLNSNGNNATPGVNGICYPWFSLEKGTTTLLGQIIFVKNNTPVADAFDTYNPPLATYPGYGKFTADNTSASPSTLELKYKQPIVPADKFYVYFTYGGNNGTVLYNDPLVENQTIYTSNEPSLTTTLTYINTTAPPYYNLTFSGASTKLVNKNNTLGSTTQGLVVGNTLTTGGGAVNLNTNNPAVAVTGGWINSAAVTQGAGNIIIGGLLTNNAGGALNLSAANLSIAGNYTNNIGGVYTQGAGTTFFNGAGAQTLADNSTTGTKFNNVNFSGGGTATMAPGTNNVNFAVANTGILTMSNNSKLVAGTIITAGAAAYLTLNSDAGGTAAVAVITGTSAITGNVNAQRFLTGGSTITNGRYVYRGYRLMSSPVNAGLVSGNYPYTINYIAASAIVSGAKSSFGTLPGNPTIYVYSEDYTPSNAGFTTGNFKGVTDISTLASPYTLAITNNGSSKALYTGNGFMFFFRGDKINSVGTSPGKTTYPFVAPESVVFTATGFLNQGSYTVNNWQTGSGLLYTTVAGNAAIMGFNLVGNPYPGTIDWEATNSGGIAATNVDPSIYVFNPVTNQYNAYSSSTHLGNPVAFTGKIASGQGFFIKANNANPMVSPSLVFNETAKSSTVINAGSGNLMMGTPAGQAVTQQLFRLRLTVDSLNYDDIAIGFKSAASAKYDLSEDSKYLAGLGAAEGLASYSADSVHEPLSINFLPLPKQKPQIIRLNVTATNSGRLTLEKTQLDSLSPIYELWLMDKYKKDSLDIRHNDAYAFDINKADTASYGSNRFELVIRQNKALGIHLLNFTAVKVSGGVQLQWKTENEQNYTNFTVERSTDNGVTFSVLGGFASNSQGTYNYTDASPVKTAGMYRVKIEDLNGAITYTQTIRVTYNGGNEAVTGSNVTIYPNPAINTINVSVNQPGAANLNLSGIAGAGNPPLNTNVSAAYSIRIVNASGVVMQSATSALPAWRHDISTLLPGTYIIQVLNNKDKSVVGRSAFVKM